MPIKLYLRILAAASVFTFGAVAHTAYKIERLTGQILASEQEFEQESARAWQELEQRELKIASYLKSQGSAYSKEIARSVILTKNPELLAAIALRESNGNPYAVGDKGLSRGAWQVQAKWWGTVPADTHKQALQASKVIDTLLMRHNGNLAKALTDYNGGGPKYAANVLNHLVAMK